MDKDFNNNNRILNFDGKLYRLQRIVDKTATDLHHIIWKRFRHQYRTNAKENIVRINRRKHIALNAFFWDKQNPREQLLEVFNLVKPVLSPWVRPELSVILNCDDDLFYIPEVLNGRNKKKKGTKGWEWSMQELNTDEGKL